jgi:hypothetical protein
VAARCGSFAAYTTLQRDPVISKELTGAYKTAVTDKALGK